MEGAHFVSTGELLSFSEQQLVSCNTNTGNLGCGGGTQDLAFEYYETDNAELESVYPYTSGSGDESACMYDSSSTTSVSVSSYLNVVVSNVDQMKAALNVGPTAVAIQANMPCFQLYKTGVMDNVRCGTNLDHAVLAVGYGTENG